jgi:hypothetical protein
LSQSQASNPLLLPTLARQKIANSSNVSKSVAVFSDAQNKANENLCLFTAHVSNNICENLCFSSDFSYDSDENYKFIGKEEIKWDKLPVRYNHQKNKECKNICLLASDLEIEEDCPLHKRCPSGCPCPGQCWKKLARKGPRAPGRALRAPAPARTRKNFEI